MFHICQPQLIYMNVCIGAVKMEAFQEQAIDTKLTDMQGYLFLSLLLSQQQKKKWPVCWKK